MVHPLLERSAMTQIEEPVLGYVNSVESFGAVDGPGVRYIIFLQGCQMRCLYCHNPDTWAIDKRSAKTADELLAEAIKYKPYWGQSGGLTVSGGEALLQIDFLIDLFTKAHELGVHTTLDTCGQPFTRKDPFFAKINRLLAVTDLVLLDIKHINSQHHKDLTRWGNENILDFATYLSEQQIPVWIRHVLVPGYTDEDQYLIELDQFIKTLKNVDKVEVLPYHAMGALKYEELSIPYKLKGVVPPTKERIENAEALLHTKDYVGYQTR